MMTFVQRVILGIKGGTVVGLGFGLVCGLYLRNFGVGLICFITGIMMGICGALLTPVLDMRDDKDDMDEETE